MDSGIGDLLDIFSLDSKAEIPKDS